MTRKTYISYILILGALTTIGPFSIDMYLPGFPAIAKDLHSTIADVSLSLASFFVGISLGQLLYGPLLDRFGRKKPLFIGLLFYIITSVGCAMAKNIDSLIVLRFIQAIGSCAAAVAAMAMVRDLFPVKENAKVFALLMLVVGASPMVAPTVGGYVTANFGWQWVFIILAIIAFLILLSVFFFLPESYKGNPQLSLKPKPILQNFLTVIVQPQFYTYTLSGAFAFAGLFAYVAGSPLVFMEVFKVGETVYGWIFAILSIGFIGASQVNNILLKKYNSESIISWVVPMQLTVAVLFFGGTALGWFGLQSTIIMLFAFLCCIGLANPNAVALSLAPFSENAGTASSLMGALQMGIGALASIGISLFSKQSALPMTFIMLITSAISLLILWGGRKNIKTYYQPDTQTETTFVH